MHETHSGVRILHLEMEGSEGRLGEKRMKESSRVSDFENKIRMIK